MKNIISIDIGSTYTKGALFSLAENTLSLEKSASVPTTPDNLLSCFDEVFEELSEKKNHELFFSSSAKGGLKIAAIGLVPELTLSAAKEAAVSAGARVSELYSYKLCDNDISALSKNPPDIILLSGGTDGGAETYNLHNAAMLAKADIKVPVIYAGNRCVSSEIARILSGMELYIVENVLPGLEMTSPEPTREKIREVFLSKITAGKGLDKIVEKTSAEPWPTPYSMLEYLKEIYEMRPDFGEFCLVDMGGATTDVYSCGGVSSPSSTIIQKGLPEPKVKRSVEGDMGMRKSAFAVFENMNAEISGNLKKVNLPVSLFEEYLRKTEADSSYLPQTENEHVFERILAEACFSGSMKRHAGTEEEIYTPQGKFLLRKGKDLRETGKLIGTGGYLAKMKSFSPLDCMKAAEGKSSLIPLAPDYYVDEKYLFPLLANISFKYPEAAVNKGIEVLSKVKQQVLKCH